MIFFIMISIVGFVVQYFNTNTTISYNKLNIKLINKLLQIYNDYGVAKLRNNNLEFPRYRIKIFFCLSICLYVYQMLIY